MKETLNKNESSNSTKPVLPAVFSSVDEAVKLLKLDRRHKWREFEGEVIYDYNYSARCSGCDGGGCFECGYKGNRRTSLPVPAFMPDGSIVKVVPQNGR